MDFEFDQSKSDSNRRKHGIDFTAAQALWEDPDRLQVPVRSEGEARFMLIGRIGEKHCSAIITMRGQNTRIISVRRSRKEEIQRYED
jgi:uncharacterized DUF497 family protein